ncbi:DUF4296 domain-containing protein [Plebeiibacterium marinum]|uniref:DUF4296 domain-containing protein n=1 Tax=Plebeiibacterium marinum TaxID=2992111 RepID=A0AAE3SJT2_9BACT|nr:DUF4296 domain-containing protein [Plebeiobacterium marinum]MCW3805824.1 DUF4296 domain-containing protein [Plebeiobacterium marinum]
MNDNKIGIQRLLIFTLLLVLMASCNMANRVPSGFPKEKEFAQILADVHFSESVISQMRLKKRDMDEVANGCYHSVLQKHNLTQEKFDTVVAWYTSQPEIYTKVYDDVVAILTEKEARWQQEAKGIKEEMERQRKLREARNIWDKENRTIRVTEKDTFDRRVPFEFLVDTINETGYRVSAYYQFKKGNMVKDIALQLIAMYQDSSYDTVKYKIPVTFSSRKVEVEIGLEDSLDIINIKGLLLQHDTLDVVNATIRNIVFEYLPVEDSVENEVVDTEPMLQK